MNPGSTSEYTTSTLRCQVLFGAMGIVSRWGVQSMVQKETTCHCQHLRMLLTFSWPCDLPSSREGSNSSGRAGLRGEPPFPVACPGALVSLTWVSPVGTISQSQVGDGTA